MRALEHSVGSLAPGGDSRFCLASIGPVPRDNFQLSLRQRGKCFCHRDCDTPMQFAPARLEQSFIGCILDERVLEGVDRFGGNTARINQFRVSEFCQRRLQVVF